MRGTQACCGQAGRLLRSARRAAIVIAHSWLRTGQRLSGTANVAWIGGVGPALIMAVVVLGWRTLWQKVYADGRQPVFGEQRPNRRGGLRAVAAFRRIALL